MSVGRDARALLTAGRLGGRSGLRSPSIFRPPPASFGSGLSPASRQAAHCEIDAQRRTASQESRFTPATSPLGEGDAGDLMNEAIARGKPKTASGIDVAERAYVRTTFIGLSVVSILATVACGGADQPAKTPDNAPTPAPAAMSGSDSSPMSPAPASSAAPSDAAPVAATTPDSMPAAQPLLSDDQILQVVHTANQGEIAQAKLAEAKAKDARVKKFAAMMIQDHSAADHKAMALAKKLNGPTPSATSASLESDAQNNTTTLESETGADFDKGYVDTQVKEHQAVLDLIDQQLLPKAKDANVKTFVTDVRAKVAMHLHHAQELQAAMAK